MVFSGCGVGFIGYFGKIVEREWIGRLVVGVNCIELYVIWICIDGGFIRNCIGVNYCFCVVL